MDGYYQHGKKHLGKKPITPKSPITPKRVAAAIILPLLLISFFLGWKYNQFLNEQKRLHMILSEKKSDLERMKEARHRLEQYAKQRGSIQEREFLRKKIPAALHVERFIPELKYWLEQKGAVLAGFSTEIKDRAGYQEAVIELRILGERKVLESIPAGARKLPRLTRINQSRVEDGRMIASFSIFAKPMPDLGMSFVDPGPCGPVSAGKSFFLFQPPLEEIEAEIQSLCQEIDELDERLKEMKETARETEHYKQVAELLTALSR